MFVKEVKDEVAIKLTDLLKARLNTLLQDNWESLVFFWTVLEVKFSTKIHNYF